MTKVLAVNPEAPEPSAIGEAARAIKAGGLVAFPTETVYGLGADALSATAVTKIFKAKRRPADNPVIVHIADACELSRLVVEVEKKAKLLIGEFWPGPLTLLFKRRPIIPDIVVAGLGTVAIRMPSHAVAMALIRESGTPIAAPSANISGSPSPTSAAHVIRDLYGRVDIILDGGETQIGLESTVLDIESDPPVLLRPGAITVEEIEELIGEIRLHPAVLAEARLDELVARSPGMAHRHYAPNARLILVEGPVERMREKVQGLASSLIGRGKRVGILTMDEYPYKADVVKRIGSRDDLEAVARSLFRGLRELDEEGVDIIVAEGVEPRSIGLAIMNRLRKASGGNIVRA